MHVKQRTFVAPQIQEGRTEQGRPYYITRNPASDLLTLYITDLPLGAFKLQEPVIHGLTGRMLAYLSCENGVATAEFKPAVANLSDVEHARKWIELFIEREFAKVPKESNDTPTIPSASRITIAFLFAISLLGALSLRLLPVESIPDELPFIIAAVFVFSLSLVVLFRHRLRNKALVSCATFCITLATVVWLNALRPINTNYQAQVLEVLPGGTFSKAPFIVRVLVQPDLAVRSLFVSRAPDVEQGDRVEFEVRRGLLSLKTTGPLRIADSQSAPFPDNE